MSDAPERIWIGPYTGDWQSKDYDISVGEPFGDGMEQEYIRADLARPKVKPLVWGQNGSIGSLWSPFNLWGGFSAHYTIDETRPGYSEVSFGITCHEFGDSVVWFGPSSLAKSAAQADYEARILSALTDPPAASE
ncbi:hypothetical protein AB3Y40_06930 [Yoonia sp. R2331]|uniref:hypothetical protein n=1 Tax=Yoonia sp. R2331 TaxID=3237238 RepID=UPI0034E5478B